VIAPLSLGSQGRILPTAILLGTQGRVITGELPPVRGIGGGLILPPVEDFRFEGVANIAPAYALALIRLITGQASATAGAISASGGAFAALARALALHDTIEVYAIGEAVAQLAQAKGVDLTSRLRSTGIVNPTPAQIIAIIEAMEQ
jgi:hypothetical protein